MHDFPSHHQCAVAVIGLGYVGLPLAVEFAKKQISCLDDAITLDRKVIGFDINPIRINELVNGIDSTKETNQEELQSAVNLSFTSSQDKLYHSDVFIVTVPTPIDEANQPDLNPLLKASHFVGEALNRRQKNTIPVIIFESTVYPGATLEECVPIIEQSSGLSLNDDFVCGYSPERINPGDKSHRLRTIVKVTSGSNNDAAQWIDKFYGSIIESGTHLASSINVAEAAKVIENTQRDLNIALINELAIIFRQMNLDTSEVLAAAGSKWNFLPFRPGLVGGHCIGVDPYYLTYKAQKLGIYPQIVLAGRRINDGMGRWIVEQLVLEMIKRNLDISKANILVLGMTFKEDCPDVRNTRVLDLIKCLKNYGLKADVYDPVMSDASRGNFPDIGFIEHPQSKCKYTAIIVAVKHQIFLEMPSSTWFDLLSADGIIYDLKGLLPKADNVISL